MFYANNEQVKGIFLNGNIYNYLAYGFGKIIPEDRNAEQLNLNLARKYLNQYRIEFGTVKDGYENALVTPRFDEPDYNGIFHTPFTYYYNGNIVPTKKVPVLITNGNYALRNALVYNDMNINGAINCFAGNTDFQGHNVNVFPEKDNYQSAPLLNYEMLNNCSNFDLNIETRFSKKSYPTLYNCNNFSGNFRYVGNQDYNYPGFRGFLKDCKDGIFNIDCTNMHGGGNDANVKNYYNFSCIQSCENMKVNITGSPWQVWPHDHSFSSNCNINTYNVISGFSYMNYCNFNVVLPKDSKPEKDKPFEFLNNAENCNYNLNALDSNLFNYRDGVGHNAFFDRLNNCNLSLLVNNTVSFDHTFGSDFNNCNIVFDNIKAHLATFTGWSYLNNCNVTGNVEAASSAQGFLERCDGINVNLNFAKSSNILAMWSCNNVRGSIVAGDTTYITHGNYMNLNVSRGSLTLNNVSNSNFDLHNGAGNTVLRNLNNVNFVERGGARYTITNLDNCHNSWIYASTVSGTIENVYNSNLRFGTFELKYNTLNVVNSHLFGFPSKANNTYNCVFIPQNLRQFVTSNSKIGSWSRLWPYKASAGITSIWTIGNCRIDASECILGGSIAYYRKNYMETNIVNYYNSVNVDLTPYNLGTRLYVHCNALNLDILGLSDTNPLHGFEESSISASNIYGRNDGVNGAYCVCARANTRIYCEDFCNVTFVPNITSGHHPVVLINNYQTTNSDSKKFWFGLTRISRLNYSGGAPFRPDLNNGACLFINNALLDGAYVNNSLLFVGSNVAWTSSTKITIGNGLIVSKANWRDHEGDVLEHINGKRFAWNVQDSGPWGQQSLLNYCLNV